MATERSQTLAIHHAPKPPHPAPMRRVADRTDRGIDYFQDCIDNY
jgi:hypothetical protein